ncbi:MULTISPECIES: immunity 49 family protein [unclassified Streptomyces]|uniref:immunity 49 family protein n=1 Tax=unclassified Streptomyces TaxID=2593676 RepID=UPI002E799D32|nr:MULTISPECIES: immunity 49 family protein [unclassified Streptomyces]MEE1762022.1 immunity 49 family protein [Streptomyces sp. SP18BB07]MEE1835516.1 immunity 49 family protein [Streptomyces sp. SP17KL33]
MTRVLERLEQSDMARRRALDTTLTFAMARCEVDPDAEEFETWEAWVTAMQLGHARFALAAVPEGDTLTCRIREKEWRLPTTGPQPYVNAHHWVTAFYLALICRENDRLGELARVPVSLLRASGATFDEYIYSWVETLQRFWLGQDGVGDHLVAAVDGTGPDSARWADQDYMSSILYPPIILFYRYLREDHEKFNEALADALRWHKEYWTASDDRAINSDGLVAFGPLAIACLAHDKGFPIEVESEYLPKALLKFSWRGEIDM